MHSADDAAQPEVPPEDLESFLATVEAENAADKARYGRRDLIAGFVAVPVLFAALATAIVWLAPVVTAWLPAVVGFAALIGPR